MTAETLRRLNLQDLLDLIERQVRGAKLIELTKAAPEEALVSYPKPIGPPLLAVGDFLIYPRFSADRIHQDPAPSTAPGPSAPANTSGPEPQIGPSPALPGKKPESPPTLQSSPAEPSLFQTRIDGEQFCAVCGVNYAIHGKPCEGY